MTVKILIFMALFLALFTIFGEPFEQISEWASDLGLPTYIQEHIVGLAISLFLFGAAFLSRNKQNKQEMM